MKLVTNFDLVDYVKNSNTPLGPFKIIRDSKKKLVTFLLPGFAAIDYVFTKDLKKTLLMIPANVAYYVLLELLLYKMIKVDPIKEKSDFYLKQLAIKLGDINVETDFELLKKSELDSRKYNVKINEKKLPEIVCSKYILVPSYGFDGKVKDTTLLQEHIIGSKSYVLSVGSPQKKLKLAYANSI